MKIVSVTVTDSKAIYIDNHRITNRSTKPWGGSPNVFICETPEDKVLETLIANGYGNLLKLIDEEPYMTKAKALL